MSVKNDSFNPCFNGFSIETEVVEELEEESEEASILVLMDFPLKLMILVLIISMYVRLQSLF